MITAFGFTLYSIDEFEAWIAGKSVARTITRIQQHHTFSPSYINCTPGNQLTLQNGMKNYHMTHGWSDIAQHFSTFPDGTIATGRSLEKAPGCIVGANSGAICIENVGDFDTGRDAMTAAQHETIVRMTAAMLKRFSLGAPDINNVVYHHWFDLNTGVKTMGTGTTKSCPGTNFFGGNTRAAFEANFAPRVAAHMAGIVAPAPAVVARHVCVNVDFLNVRTGPTASAALVDSDDRVILGSILRVYDTENGWLKIANSKERWIYGARTYTVQAGTVNTEDTNVRSGPGTEFPIIDVLQPGQTVYAHDRNGAWAKIAMNDRWSRSDLITFA